MSELRTAQLEIRGGKRHHKGNGRGKHRGEEVVAYAVVRDDDFTRDVLIKMSWSLDGNGYPQTHVIRSDGMKTKKCLHQIVFEQYYGRVPPGLEIDHENCNRLDSRPENLRAVTSSVNKANSGRRSDNTSGYKGVSWYKQYGKWRAGIGVNRKDVHLGYFSCKHQAARAVNRAYKKYFPEVRTPNPIAELLGHSESVVEEEDLFDILETAI